MPSLELTSSKHLVAVNTRSNNPVESFLYEPHDASYNTKNWRTVGPLGPLGALVRFFHEHRVNIATPYVGVAVEQVFGRRAPRFLNVV